MNFTVRPYTPEDRASVRHICCESGCMGRPVEDLFCDREVFADFFTRYYTDFEPEHSLVADDNGVVVGYLICCVNHRRYRWRQAQIVTQAAPKVAARALSGHYDRRSLRFLRWVVTRAVAETPAAPAASAHFHLNVLPAWRNGRVVRHLVFPFLQGLHGWGVRRVFGQIQLYDDRRPLKVFERYGFRLFDQKRVSKFEDHGKAGVYVTTLVYDAV